VHGVQAMKEKRFKKVVKWEGKGSFFLEGGLLIISLAIIIFFEKTNWIFWYAIFLSLVSVIGMEGNLKSRNIYWEEINE
jgi:hypothetical protein